MKVWLIQYVLSPYRIPLFQRIAETPGIDFHLILLSDRFQTRPEWKRELATLPFTVEVPLGFGYRTGPEHEYCINPFLLAKMIAERPEVVLCGGYNLATVQAWLYHKLGGAPYVIWTEATMTTDGGIRGARLRLRRRMAGDAAGFIEAGTLAREYVRHLAPGIPDRKLFRAFNCVDTPQFKKPAAEARLNLRKWGVPPRFLLFVGKLNERKGIPALLEVYRRMALSDPELGLVLVGEGPLRSDIEDLKEKHSLRILLPGFLRNEETADFYAAASAFMLMSQRDHNPLVLLEALGAGIPVICSRYAGNAIDFIDEGANGYVVEPSAIPQVVEKSAEVVQWDAARRAHCEKVSALRIAGANYGSATGAFIAACRLAVATRSAAEGVQPGAPDHGCIQNRS